MNEKDLIQMIREQFSLILLEQEEETPQGDEPDAKPSSSVDEQIDELLLQYEKLSSPDEEQMLQEMISKGSLRFILEQEEPEEEAEEEEAIEDVDEEDADDAEDDSMVPEEVTPSIDIGTFATKVARLAEMPEKVLDLKNAIINRAVQYLEQNYDDNVAKDFENALLDRFQLSVPATEIENLVAADLPAPPAVGAGSGGAAGG